MSGRQLMHLLLAAGVGAGYLWLGYVTSIASDASWVGLFVGLAPLTAAAAALAWRSQSNGLRVLCLSGIVALVVQRDFLRTHAAWVYFVQHAGIHALLGITFGRTLGGEPAAALCSRTATMLFGEGVLDAAFYRYTWSVTLAWTLYFAAASGVSTLLFFSAPATVWSAYANLLTPALISTIFVVEFLVRKRVLPAHQHASIEQTIRAYRRYSQRLDGSHARP